MMELNQAPNLKGLRTPSLLRLESENFGFFNPELTVTKEEVSGETRVEQIKKKKLFLFIDME